MATDTQPQVYARMLKARAAFGPVLKNKTNPHFKSRYADLQAVLEAVEGPLTEQGLLIVQRPEVSPDGVSLVTEVVSVEDGSRLEPCVYPVRSANDTDPQKLAAAMTYARRYSLLMVLGLAPEDDDGNTAARVEQPQPVAKPTTKPAAAPAPEPAPEPATARQKQRIDELTTQLGITVEAFQSRTKKRFNKTDWHDLTAAEAGKVIAALEKEAGTHAG